MSIVHLVVLPKKSSVAGNLPMLASTRCLGRVSDQLSDRLIFGRLFQANEKFSTFRSYANL